MPESDKHMISRWKKEVNEAYHDILAKRQNSINLIAPEIAGLILPDATPIAE
ncbi:MAG: hypothetical protein WCJ60_04945 [bacterium]